MYLILKIKDIIWPSDLLQKDIEAEQSGIGLPEVKFGDRYATFVWAPWIKEAIPITEESETMRLCSILLRHMAMRRGHVGYVHLDKGSLRFVIESIL